MAWINKKHLSRPLPRHAHINTSSDANEVIKKDN